VLEDSSQTVSQALPDNVALLARLSGYVLDMLNSGASSKITDDELDLLGDYRKSVLA